MRNRIAFAEHGARFRYDRLESVGVLFFKINELILDIPLWVRWPVSLQLGSVYQGGATDPQLSKITREPQILVLVSLGKETAGVDEAELLALNWLGGIARDESSGGCECVYGSSVSAPLLRVH